MNKSNSVFFALTGLLFFLFLDVAAKQPSRVIIYPAPKSEQLSTVYQVTVNNKKLPVYNAKIGAGDNNRRFKAVDDLMHSADYFDVAAFGYFDMQGSATVRVSLDDDIKTFKILPLSAHVTGRIIGRFLTFTVKEPKNLTVELNGEWVKSLHIFINPIEITKPKPTDPNVIFYGPGVHYVSKLLVGNNKTVYIAGGAIIKLFIDKGEPFGIEPSGLKNFSPRIILEGSHIKLLGRGIIDATDVPVHAANVVMLKGRNIKMSGLILRNSCGWTVPLRQCDSVLIDNIKILGYRANSDGIDICNSRNVTVEKCFVRSNDDLIVVKTEQNEGIAKNIVVKDCILWNELAHALSLGAELREDVSDVVFENCDIIHDTGREWSLRVFQSDSSTVKNILFKNIRLEDTHNLISLWIGKNANTLDKDFGNIRNVVFKDIYATGTPLAVSLTGATNSSRIEGVRFEHILLNTKPLTRQLIFQNEFVRGVTVAN